VIQKEEFLAAARAYQRGGWRLALVNATAVLPAPGAEAGGFELCWSFEKNGRLEHLRSAVAADEEVPSISDLFGSAFIYENEIRDLFGVKVTGIAVDFKGELYRTATKVPMSPRAIRERLEARSKRS
jgi:ech hydrogenase subunit D